jgi:hypothetical protein
LKTPLVIQVSMISGGGFEVVRGGPQSRRFFRAYVTSATEHIRVSRVRISGERAAHGSGSQVVKLPIAETEQVQIDAMTADRKMRDTYYRSSALESREHMTSKIIKYSAIAVLVCFDESGLCVRAGRNRRLSPYHYSP